MTSSNRRADVLAALITVALTNLALVLVLRLWRADLDVPFAYSGDALFNLATVKGLIDHGWWFENSSLGAPHGLDLHDFAMGGDHLHLLFLKVLGEVTGSAAAAVNLYYLLGFTLSALTSFLVIRWFGISRPVAVVCSVLFALAPYVLLRNEVHLFLSVDFTVPLAAYLVLAVWAGAPLFSRRPSATGNRPWAYASPRTLLTLAICVAIGSTGSFYYPIFAVVLLAAAGALRFLATRERRALATSIAVVGAIGLVMVVNLIPTGLYALEHGRNDAVAQRAAWETEFHSLKLTQLVLPVAQHRVRWAADLKARYDATATPATSEATLSTLGLVASLGLVWLLIVAVAGVAAPGRGPTRDPRHGHLAASALVALLAGTVGGGAALFSYLINPQLRGWSRISIFIAFFALVAVGLLLDMARSRLSRRPGGRVMAGALLAGTLLVALYDQTTNGYVPAYEGLKAGYAADARFVEDVERTLPPGAAVFQLPVMPFPESPPSFRVTDYELARPYLHSDRLRWSYGAMKGRPADWQSALPGKPTGTMLAAVAGAGFDGLVVDRFGYPDGGRALEAELSRIMGISPRVSIDQRLAFFDLTAVRRGLARTRPPGQLRALRTAALRPLRIRTAAQARQLDPGGSTRAFAATSPALRIELENPGPAPRRAVVTVAPQRVAASPARVLVRFPQGQAAQVQAGAAPAPVRRQLMLPPGRTAVELSTAGPRLEGLGVPMPYYFKAAIVLSDSGLLPFGMRLCPPGRVPRGALQRLVADAPAPERPPDFQPGCAL